MKNSFKVLLDRFPKRNEYILRRDYTVNPYQDYLYRISYYISKNKTHGVAQIQVIGSEPRWFRKDDIYIRGYTRTDCLKKNMKDKILSKQEALDYLMISNL